LKREAPVLFTFQGAKIGFVLRKLAFIVSLCILNKDEMEQKLTETSSEIRILLLFSMDRLRSEMI
jgi:hypothetical protein